jgi:methyl-accepting chemotaxis protein
MPVQNVLNKKQKLLSEFNSLIDKTDQTVQAIENQSSVSEVSTVVYVFAIFCFILGLWFIYCVSLVYKVSFDNLKYIIESRRSMMRKSIKVISDEAQLISKGNFTKRISENGTELDVLSKDLNKHIKLFQDKMIEMKKSIKNTDKAVRKTNEASSVYMDVSTNQIDSILKTVEEVFQLTSKISEINKNSEELVRFSDQTSKVAKQGVQASKESNNAIISVGNKIKEASEKTEKFQESSNKIKNVIFMMKELAEQLNVLSINASIQASKSGESGKSFDVVAKGMQSLARRSAEAAEHADVLIQNTLQNVDSVQTSVSLASEEIDRSANLSIATQESLQDIVNFCSVLSKNVADINKKASEQAANAKNVTKDAEDFLKNMESYKESYQNFVKANEVASQEIKKLYGKGKEVRA